MSRLPRREGGGRREEGVSDIRGAHTVAVSAGVGDVSPRAIFFSWPRSAPMPCPSGAG